jgi:hypothetical protein
MLKESPRPIFRPFIVERKETKSRRPGAVIVTCKTKANRDEICPLERSCNLADNAVMFHYNKELSPKTCAFFSKHSVM